LLANTVGLGGEGAETFVGDSIDGVVAGGSLPGLVFAEAVVHLGSILAAVLSGALDGVIASAGGLHPGFVGTNTEVLGGSGRAAILGGSCVGGDEALLGFPGAGGLEAVGTVTFVGVGSDGAAGSVDQVVVRAVAGRG